MNMYKIINYVNCSREQLLEILKLRNLDSIRMWMTTPELITEDSHFAFIDSLKVSKNHIYFAVFDDEELVGTFNLTKNEDGSWDRGIFASPKIQGRGDTLKWEQALLSELSQYGINVLTAKVKIDNVRSQKYHIKVGYRMTKKDSNYIYYILDTRLIPNLGGAFPVYST